MGIESDIPDVPSVVLGSGAVSPLEMASAYSSFATNGRWARPYLVSRIVDATGEVIYERSPERTQVIDPALAAAARRPLEEVPVNGTGANANIGRTQAGKTGTHMEHRDAWYVGFVPEYTAAVWVGFPDEQRELVDVVANGQRYDRVFGGTVPAPIWGEFMSHVLEDVPESDFPGDPPGVAAYFKVPTTIVPSVVGLDEGSALAVLREAGLVGVSATVVSLETRGTVLSQSIGAGAEVVQGSTVTIGISTGELPKTAMPNLRGLTVDEAIAALDALEAETGVGALTVGVANEPVRSPRRVGVVIATNPPPGAVLQWGGTVTLVVGVLSEEPPGGGNGNGGGEGD
jgi:membrane peptidoglycan carboxypeptidase